jgi:hypothetical protein
MLNNSRDANNRRDEDKGARHSRYVNIGGNTTNKRGVNNSRNPASAETAHQQQPEC